MHLGTNQIVTRSSAVDTLEKLTSDDEVLQTISGYKITLCSHVYQSHLPKQPVFNDIMVIVKRR
ncbi:unnamed protein product [Ceratitis capitata]|uniref:(Mediterranean fruit fly) hypothetical protein n=1 Tax=Ceratitis capitata TaxID=7213 RepID=A0A811UIQ0_CERCA|nr:unnamed protein product [Ceratitis capitata]